MTRHPRPPGRGRARRARSTRGGSLWKRSGAAGRGRRWGRSLATGGAAPVHKLPTGFGDAQRNPRNLLATRFVLGEKAPAPTSSPLEGMTRGAVAHGTICPQRGSVYFACSRGGSGRNGGGEGVRTRSAPWGLRWVRGCLHSVIGPSLNTLKPVVLKKKHVEACGFCPSWIGQVGSSALSKPVSSTSCGFCLAGESWLFFSSTAL